MIPKTDTDSRNSSASINTILVINAIRTMVELLGSPRGLILACSLLLSPHAQSAVQFQFQTSGQAPFSHATLGPVRTQALQEAGQIVGQWFNHTATIHVNVIAFNTPGNGVLAGASTYYAAPAVGQSGFRSGVVSHKIRTQLDQNGSSADGLLEINFAWNWDYDDDIGSAAIDFKSTIIHELLHLCGFTSELDFAGTDVYGTPPGTPGIWEPFERYLTNVGGQPIIATDFRLNFSRWQAVRTGGSSPASGLFFSGPKAIIANGGLPVGLYSPTTWEEASSAAHLDDTNPALANYLMDARLVPGPSTRRLSSIERAILEDIGYNMNPISAPNIIDLKTPAGISTIKLEANPGMRLAIQSSTDRVNWTLRDTQFVSNRQTYSRTITLPTLAPKKSYWIRLHELLP